jgi:hypothetical protein
VAVTAMEYAAAPWTPPDLDPPQAVSKPRPTALRISKCSKRRRFLKPKQDRRAARAAIGISGRGLPCRAASAVVVLTVSVVEVVPGGVTVAGEKLHVAPGGKPEQLNEIAEVNPTEGATETENVALCPAVTVCNAGVTVRLKAGGRVKV